MLPKHIVITGPESTGKTTLAKQLAQELGTVWVPEFARYYLEQTGPEYRYEHLSLMLEGQRALELSLDHYTPIIHDTDWLTYYIWGMDKFDTFEPWWVPRDLYNRYYLVCYPDLPWQHDPLREDRDRLFELFEKYLLALQKFQLEYHIIKGKDGERINRSLHFLDK